MVAGAATVAVAAPPEEEDATVAATAAEAETDAAATVAFKGGRGVPFAAHVAYANAMAAGKSAGAHVFCWHAP